MKIVLQLMMLFVVTVFGAPVHAQAKAIKAAPSAVGAKVPNQSVGASVYRKNVDSVVQIDAEDSGGRAQGSGVAFKNGSRKNETGTLVPWFTWIVTNAHVVKNASTVVVTVDGFQTKGIVQLRDLKMDIAFIRLDGTVLKPVEFTKGSAVLMPGDVVFALGAPQGLTRSITEGIVSARRTIDGISLVQTSAAISPGSSGGGLFNSAGQLAGITTFKVAKGESLNFAIEIAEVMKLHDASRDAQAIVLGVDLSSRLAFEGAFVRWLYTERGETGRTVLDEYREAEDRMSRGALTLAELSEKSREIVDRYYQRINPSNVKSASLTGNAANSPTTLVLVCQLYGDPDRPSSAKSYVVDFEKRLINSRPAKISSEFMRYSYLNDEGTEFTTVFDRNAATVAISTAEFPNLFQGKCAKSEGRAF